MHGKNKLQLAGTVTLQQVADLVGTSKSTVSRVFAGDPRISQATCDRVKAVLNQHGYRPNMFARALAGGKTGQLGVLTSNISSGFFAEVIRGIDIAASQSRGRIVVSIAHGIDDYYVLLDELLESGHVDGLVLIDPPLGLFQRELPPDHRPLVLCAARQPAQAAGWDRVDCVTVDNGGAMEQIVDHLAGQGITRMIHLAGPRTIFDAQQRRRAFVSAIRKRGLSSRCPVVDGHLIQEDGCAVMRTRFGDPKDWPEAFVAFNDSVACGVLSETRKAARPCVVTGWDNTPAAEVLEVTSVEMPLTRLGEACARLLLDRIEGQVTEEQEARQVVLGTELRVRGSSQFKPSRRG